MKRILFLFIMFISGSAYAQKLPDFGMDRVRIAEADQIIQAELIPVSSMPTAKSDCFYYWYKDNNIHSSQGGYSGKLLNGKYEAYYLNHNLKEQGAFKKGLKDGIWKSWNEDGTLRQAANLKNGEPVPANTVSFWDKVNILKKKPKQTPADSATKKH